MDPTDILPASTSAAAAPPAPAPVEKKPAPAAAARADGLACEFCGCELAPSGDVLRFSERAKAFRDQSFTLDDVRRQLAEKVKAYDLVKAKYDKLVDDLKAAEASDIETPWYKRSIL